MKVANPFSIEQTWDNLLSCQKDKILTAFIQLCKSDQLAVLKHLKRMVIEDGWHREQKQSATAALKVLKNRTQKNK